MKRRDTSRILKSSIALARHLLDRTPPEALDTHIKELLSVLIWKASEADGKHNVRYWSEGYYLAQDRKPEHEHVFERKKIISRMMANPHDVESQLSQVAACLVLKEEHDLLTRLGRSEPALDGWDRYKKAGLRVWDTKERVFLW